MDGFHRFSGEKPGGLHEICMRGAFSVELCDGFGGLALAYFVLL